MGDRFWMAEILRRTFSDSSLIIVLTQLLRKLEEASPCEIIEIKGLLKDWVKRDREDSSSTAPHISHTDTEQPLVENIKEAIKEGIEAISQRISDELKSINGQTQHSRMVLQNAVEKSIINMVEQHAKAFHTSICENRVDLQSAIKAAIETSQKSILTELENTHQQTQKWIQDSNKSIRTTLENTHQQTQQCIQDSHSVTNATVAAEFAQWRAVDAVNRQRDQEEAARKKRQDQEASNRMIFLTCSAIGLITICPPLWASGVAIAACTTIYKIDSNRHNT